MKSLALFVLLAASALSLEAGIKVEVLVVTEEDVAKRALPFTCERSSAFS